MGEGGGGKIVTGNKLGKLCLRLFIARYAFMVCLICSPGWFCCGGGKPGLLGGGRFIYEP